MAAFFAAPRHHRRTKGEFWRERSVERRSEKKRSVGRLFRDKYIISRAYGPRIVESSISSHSSSSSAFYPG
ncbi:hypothetical protein OROMI_013434 [Orobanche minor]